MRYNTLSDHSYVYEIPILMIDDQPLWLGITQDGWDHSHGETRSRWAYTFATGPYDADVQLQGDDVSGPAAGPDPDPSDMAATVMGFYSAFAGGDLTHPDTSEHSAWEPGEAVLEYENDVIATGEAAEFIVANGERFGMTASELENGYIAYTDEYLNETLGQNVFRAEPTGREDE